MYEFHYDYSKNKYDNNSRLSFTDSDSIMNEFKIEDVYENFSNDKEIFGFSDYLPKSKYYNGSNKPVSWLKNLLEWRQRCIRFW